MKESEVNDSLSDDRSSLSVKQKTILFYILLFSIAFIPRLFHLLLIADNPFFHFPIIDCQTYDNWAQRIAAGHWVGEKVFWQAPLYPYFLAIVYSVFGHDLFLTRLIQILLGSVNCLLLYKIAQTAFNPRIALIAFLIACFYGPFLFFEVELLNPVLIIFFNLTSVWILFSFHHQPKKIKLFFAGIILGLSSITFGLAITFLPLTLLWTVIILLKNKNPVAKIANFCLCLMIGFLLVISFTLVRNLIVGKDFVFISSNAGINFFIGNNPDYEKTTSIRPGIEWEELIQRPLQHGFQKPSERSKFFWRQAFSFIGNQPISYLKLLFRKFLLLMDGYEIKRNQDMLLFTNYSFLLRLLLWRGVIYFPFGVLLPLSLTGMIIFWRDRSKSEYKNPKSILILYFLLSQVVALLFFFICARYRLPLVPFLIIFAGFALYRLYEKLKTKISKDIFVFLLTFLTFLFLSNMSHHKLTPKDQAEEHYNLGTAYGRADEFDQAIGEYNQALLYQPNHLMTHFNMALLYQNDDWTDQAVDKYRHVIKLFPRGALAYNNLGLIYEGRGDLPEAEELYIKASRYHALLPDPLYNLGNVYVKMEKYQQAKKKFEACLKLDPTYYKAYNGLGDLSYRSGETDKAIVFFKKALELQPNYAVAHNNLGTAYIKKGLRQMAFSEFEEAIKVYPDYGSAHLNMGNWYLEQGNAQKAIAAYQRAVELTPPGPRVHYHLAVAYVMLGFKDEAIAEINRALSADSSFLPAKELLERIKDQ